MHPYSDYLQSSLSPDGSRTTHQANDLSHTRCLCCHMGRANLLTKCLVGRRRPRLSALLSFSILYLRLGCKPWPGLMHPSLSRGCITSFAWTGVPSWRIVQNSDIAWIAEYASFGQSWGITNRLIRGKLCECQKNCTSSIRHIVSYICCKIS